MRHWIGNFLVIVVALFSFNFSLVLASENFTYGEEIVVSGDVLEMGKVLVSSSSWEQAEIIVGGNRSPLPVGGTSVFIGGPCVFSALIGGQESHFVFTNNPTIIKYNGTRIENGAIVHHVPGAKLTSSRGGEGEMKVLVKPQDGGGQSSTWISISPCGAIHISSFDQYVDRYEWMLTIPETMEVFRGTILPALYDPAEGLVYLSGGTRVYAGGVIDGKKPLVVSEAGTIYLKYHYRDSDKVSEAFATFAAGEVMSFWKSYMEHIEVKIVTSGGVAIFTMIDM